MAALATASVTASAAAARGARPARGARCLPAGAGAGAGAGGRAGGAPETLVVRRTLRGGQTASAEGTLVVLGDVNRNAAVSAGGDVVVWGRLRGEATAGLNGDEGAVICALEMEPSQLSIAGVVSFGPEEGAQGGGAEVASVDSDSGRVVISAAGRRFGADGTPGAATVAAAAAGQHASRAALLTGLYIAAAGAALFAAPLQTFSLLFSTQLISSGWIQVFGVLCMAFGAYYVGAARAGARGFLQATVYGRLGIFAAFGWLVARGVAEASLLLLGLVNAAGALVMWNAMRRDDGQRAAAPY